MSELATATATATATGTGTGTGTGGALCGRREPLGIRGACETGEVGHRPTRTRGPERAAGAEIAGGGGWRVAEVLRGGGAWRFGALLVLLGFAVAGVAQTDVEGEVTYVTSRNIYVRFASTEGLGVGDSLRTTGGEACLVIEQLSSTSCITQKVAGCEIALGDKIRARRPVSEPVSVGERSEPSVPVGERSEPSVPVDERSEPPVDERSEPSVSERSERPVSRLKGSWTTRVDGTEAMRDGHAGLSMARVSNRLALEAENLAGLPLGFEVGANIQSTYRDESSSYPGWRQRNTVYNAAVNGVVGVGKEAIEIHVGRRMAQRFPGIGAVDGLHMEWTHDGWRLGVLSGFQPRLSDWTVDVERPAWGVVAGRKVNGDVLRTDWTVGYLNQTRSAATDREFLFGQVRSSIGRTVDLFGSGELDVYGTQQSTRLRSLFGSATWRFLPTWRWMVSVDRREAVIYYATYEQQVLEALLARSGQTIFRTRLSGRFAEDHSITVGASERRDTTSLATTFHFSYTWNDIPLIGGRLTYRNFASDYETMHNGSHALSYDCPIGQSGKTRLELHHRYVRVTYNRDGMTPTVQGYSGGGLKGRVGENWSWSANAEFSNQKYQNLLRLQARITYRFKYSDAETDPD